jgi:GTP-binding protein HflX
MGRLPLSSDAAQEIALLIGGQFKNRRGGEVNDSLDELALLADTAGAKVADRVICRPFSIHPATFIGKGKAAQIADQAREAQVTVIVFDEDLSPVQSRNLEEEIGVKVIDRTQLILDIFAQHARTKEGGLQIEMAQLQYLLPRIRQWWTGFEQQKGGIGLRGPGERQLELDRRRIQERISRIGKALENVRDHRAEQRRGRRRHGWALITLVGYTNAGKSTLLNSLTGAHVEAGDRLFATLDPTTRQIRLPNNQLALITDTVGFIRKLPHHLVESFKATLEEVNEADLLLHVIDVSHPRVDEQIEAVEEVLHELGVKEKPILPVLNKIDLPTIQNQWGRLSSKLGRAIPVSALTGEGLDALRDELADFLRNRSMQVDLRIPASDGRLLASIRSSGKILSAKYGDDGFVQIVARIPGRLYGQCKQFLVEHAGPKNDKGS